MNSEPKLIKEKTSLLLQRVIAEAKNEHISLGELLLLLRHRSFGGLFILLSLLCLIPGISIFAGLLILLPATQLSLGFKAPWLPAFLRERPIRSSQLKLTEEKVIPIIIWVERYVKPRVPLLSSHLVFMFVGVLAIPLAIVITLPLPFSNLLPAIALFFLAFGILEKDGLMIMFGLFLAGVALCVGYFIVLAASDWLRLVLSR